MKLTPAQSALIRRPLCEGHDFILLMTSGDDRVAKALEAKGLGSFVSHAWRYTWRKRDGYLNHFIPNKKGLDLRRSSC